MSESLDKIIEKYHKSNISFTCRGKKRFSSIKCFIPMRRYKGNDIVDVEILTCKKRNHYFSAKCYLENKSSYSNLYVYDSKDQRVKKRAPINLCSCGELSAENKQQTYNILSELFQKLKQENKELRERLEVNTEFIYKNSEDALLIEENFYKTKEELAPLRDKLKGLRE